MPPVLKIKRSATSGSAPTSLSDGELAVNTTDKKLYVGTSGSVVELTGGAGGGITSIGLNVPSIFTSNGTITSNGSLGFSLNNQNANLIFASPDNTSGAPSFRTLVPKDLAASGTANQYLQINSSGNLTWNTISTSGGAPSGTEGEIQIGKSTGFSSKSSFNFDDFIFKNIPTTRGSTYNASSTGATVGNFIVNFFNNNFPVGDQYFIFKPNHGFSNGDLVKYTGPNIFDYISNNYYYITCSTSHTFKLASSRANAFNFQSLTTNNTTGLANIPTTATSLELQKNLVDKYTFNIGSAFNTKYSLLNNNISIGATIVEPTSPGSGSSGTTQVWSGLGTTAVHQGIYFNGSRPVPFKAKSNTNGNKLFIQVPSENRNSYNPPPEIAQLTIGDRLATLTTDSSVAVIDSTIYITISSIAFIASANTGEGIPTNCWIITLTGGTVTGGTEYNCVMFISHRTHRNIIRSKSDMLHPTYYFIPNNKASGMNDTARKTDYALTCNYRDEGLFIITDNYLRIGFTNRKRDSSSGGINYLDSGDANYSSESVISDKLPHITFEPDGLDTFTGNSNVGGASATDMTGSGRMFFRGLPTVAPNASDVIYIPVIYAGQTAGKITGPYNAAFDANQDNYIRLVKYTWGSTSNLTGGGGVDITQTESLLPSEDGSITKIIKLADEVPINTSLTVPLIKGTAGGDLNITTSNPDTDIILAIPPNNTDIVLSTGSIYITSGLDGGDIYVQSAEDVYLTSQNVRVSGNLIVDGYIQSGTGFQGDNTDAEEPITGLVMDGGTF